MNSAEITAEKLLKDKEGDPLGASVGAYSLLQFGELDRLHDWTSNLMNWFVWLPDGLAIRGEHLARLGQHQEALAVFSQLPSRGVPQFTVGLSYAVNRLKVYTGASGSEFDPAVRVQAQQALAYLDDICHYADLLKPVLNIEGMRQDAIYPTGIAISGYL